MTQKKLLLTIREKGELEREIEREVMEIKEQKGKNTHTNTHKNTIMKDTERMREIPG